MERLNVPPHSLQAEQAVLGSILLDNTVMQQVAEIVKPEHFYTQVCADIYGAMKALYASNKPIDLVTLPELVEAEFSYIASLMKDTPSTANVKTYCETIVQKWHGRQLIAAGHSLVESIYAGEDYEQSRQRAYNDLEKLFQVHGEETIADGEELAACFINELERASQSTDGLQGWSTGDKHIDEATGGFMPGDYIGMAARSGGGKTTRALNILLHFALKDRRCLMFSMEMKKQRVMQKLISDASNVWFNKIKSGSVVDDSDAMAFVTKAFNDIRTSKLHVDDSSGLTISDIERKARRLKAKYGELDLIVIDYIQRIKIDSSNFYSEMTTASNRLKDLFMELGCAGIVLAQLKKNSMAMPNASDLRETGAIENDSDLLIFLHTDTEDRKPKKGVMTCEIFNKVRYGETCIKMLRNELECQRFVPVDAEYEEPEEKGGFR